MSDAVLIALIGNGALIVCSIIVSVANHKKLDTIHKATNSMKDELVATTKSDSFKDGVQHQKDVDGTL